MDDHLSWLACEENKEILSQENDGTPHEFNKDQLSEKPWLIDDFPPYISCKKTFDDILYHCIKKGADDVLLKVDSKFTASAAGNNKEISKRRLTRADLEKIVNVITRDEGSLNKLNSGNHIWTSYKVYDESVDSPRLRVSINADISGYDITMRVLPDQPLDLDALDLEPDLLEAIKSAKNELILVAGETNSGKSTLTSAMIKYYAINNNNAVITTFEEPIETTFEKVEVVGSIIRQAEVGKHVKSFADGVKGCSRRSPTHVLVGEINCPNTISATLEVVNTGKLVVSTVHASNVASIIPRLMYLVPEHARDFFLFDLISNARLFIHQILHRTKDGKRASTREYLFFDKKLKEKILDICKSSGMSAAVIEIKKTIESRGTTHQAGFERYQEKGITIIPKH